MNLGRDVVATAHGRKGSGSDAYIGSSALKVATSQ